MRGAIEDPRTEEEGRADTEGVGRGAFRAEAGEAEDRRDGDQTVEREAEEKPRAADQALNSYPSKSKKEEVNEIH
jgi:hypothetical protein